MLLYLHIPFCDSKCSYCAFNSYVDLFSRRESYMRSLHQQLEHEMERFAVSVSNPIETVFIGGGTPSTVEPELYRLIFDTIKPYLAPDCEVTAEANPNSATVAWMEGMLSLGVNRLSFGVQSFNDEKLRLLGRAHRSVHAINALKSAGEIGFPHLSLDLIYGVLGDTKSLLESDLEHAFSLPIDHISLYALTIEESTPFEQTPDMADERLNLTRWLFERLAQKGFEQYEISNFGRYRSRHNMGYWEHKPYMGVGAGAVGFLGNNRFYPSKDVEYYIQNPLETVIEPLDASSILSEKLFLGFRSCVGVDAALLNPVQRSEAEVLRENALLEYFNGRYYNRDYLLADEIALRVEGF